MHIKQLKLNNFQIHEDVTFDFEKGFNVICGPSDKGKTSIVRALNWIFFNEWDSSFLRTGKKEVYAKIILDNGVEIVRKRNSKENSYLLNEKEFSGFGVDVPFEIKQALQIDKAIFGKSQLFLNIADQFSLPFLLFDVDSQKAQVLMSLVGGDKIDFAIKSLASDILKQTTEKNKLSNLLESENTKLQEFAYLENQERLLNKIDNFLISYDEIYFKLQDLYVLSDNISKLRLEVIELEKAKKDLTVLEDQFIRYEELSKTKQDLVKILGEVVFIKNSLKELNLKYESNEQEISKISEEFMRKLVENKSCPFCGSLLEEKKLKEIASKL